MKTVGSYFAHLSSVIDYVRRAMPFGDAQSLSNDELYAVVAYVLNLNDIVDDKFVLSKETWAQVKMPNAGGFYRRRSRDDRKGLLESKSLHEGLQGAGDHHRARIIRRRDAGREDAKTRSGVAPSRHFAYDSPGFFSQPGFSWPSSIFPSPSALTTARGR